MEFLVKTFKKFLIISNSFFNYYNNSDLLQMFDKLGGPSFSDN